MKSNHEMISCIWSLLLATASAHTWIEQLNLIDPTGAFTGDPGFTRGHIFRNDSAFNDAAAEYQITGPSVPADAPMCRASQQNQAQQPNAGPVLQAPSGASIALRYLENGHVTQKNIRPRKPSNGGTVYVYGTTNPQPNDLFLDVHRVWNADGTGGDGRGKLLSTQNFDDGQCYQVNPGNAVYDQRVVQFPLNPPGENWCQQDVKLPTDVTSGLYTLYWVWDWPDLPDGTNGVNQEIYTSCMDIQLSDSTGVSTFTDASRFAAPAAFNDVAISSEMADITNPTAVDDSAFTAAFSTTSGNNAGATLTPVTGPEGSTTPFQPSTSDFNSASSTLLPIPNTSGGFSAPAASSTGFETPFASSTDVATSFGFSAQPTPSATFGSAPSVTEQPGSAQTHSHHHGGGGFGDASSFTDSAPSTTSDSFGSAATTSSASFGDTTPAPPNNGDVVTVTEIDSVMETVLMTVTTGTTFQKRYAKTQTQSIILPTETSAPTTCTKTGAKARIGLKLRGRNPLFALPKGGPEGDDC